MADRKALLAGLSAGALLMGAAQGQDAQNAGPAPAASEQAQAGAGEPGQSASPNPDEMANQLNAQQQIRQSFTVTRTINGEVVDTDRRTITYDRHAPYRETEAGQTPVEQLKTAFDREVLTRTEAFEEAKLDFTMGDVNRDGSLSEAEFIALARQWRADEARDAAGTDAETARQRQYRAFLDEIAPEETQAELEESAREKYLFMAGAAGALSREDYIREYLLDFDTMDKNGDMLLKGGELMEFRAANRGEAISTQ